MRKTIKRVNTDITRTIKKYGNKKATEKLFADLSKMGGSAFRRAMRRLHRIAKKLP